MPALLGLDPATYRPHELHSPERQFQETNCYTDLWIESLDVEGERMRYFHGPGYYEVAGDDYRNVLRLGREFSVDVLPPFIEFVRGDRLAACPPDQLRAVAAELLDVQVARTPAENPVS